MKVNQQTDKGIGVDNTHYLNDGLWKMYKNRKSSGKRVIGIHFVDNYTSRVVITCENSKIRILDGTEIVNKQTYHFRGGDLYLPLGLRRDADSTKWKCEILASLGAFFSRMPSQRHGQLIQEISNLARGDQENFFLFE
ncbi:hypothetical protein Leryth_014127 [Lithospermum erythrorhizon]|nr:hypothetical protein Leryth_014127 [Lithospermum erythrorhizon]